MPADLWSISKSKINAHQTSKTSISTMWMWFQRLAQNRQQCVLSQLIASSRSIIHSSSSVTAGYSGKITQSAVNSKPRPKKLEDILDRMDDNEQAEIDAMMARAIYGSGNAFSTVEHPLWQALFKKPRPPYWLPSRDELSNKLLDSEYACVYADSKQLISRAIIFYVISVNQFQYYVCGIQTLTAFDSRAIVKAITKHYERHAKDGFVCQMERSHAAQRNGATALLHCKIPHQFDQQCVVH